MFVCASCWDQSVVERHGKLLLNFQRRALKIMIMMVAKNIYTSI